MYKTAYVQSLTDSQWYAFWYFTVYVNSAIYWDFFTSFHFILLGFSQKVLKFPEMAKGVQFVTFKGWYSIWYTCTYSKLGIIKQMKQETI